MFKGAKQAGKAEDGEGNYCGFTDGLREQELQGKRGGKDFCSCQPPRTLWSGHVVVKQRRSFLTVVLTFFHWCFS